MKLVIAGNYQQFREWLRETGTNPRDARFVDRMEQVKGMRGAEIILYGEYWQNELSKHLNEVKASIL